MNGFVGYMVETAKMPRRRSSRFRRIRRVAPRLRRAGRRARRGIGGKFGNFGEIGKGAFGLLVVAKLKDFLGIHLGGNGSALDRDAEMIITGLVGPHAKLGNGHLVPAGASALIADLADGFIFGGQSIGMAGGSNFAGASAGGNFAGD